MAVERAVKTWTVDVHLCAKNERYITAKGLEELVESAAYYCDAIVGQDIFLASDHPHVLLACECDPCDIHYDEVSGETIHAWPMETL